MSAMIIRNGRVIDRASKRDEIADLVVRCFERGQAQMLLMGASRT